MSWLLLLTDTESGGSGKELCYNKGVENNNAMENLLVELREQTDRINDLVGFDKYITEDQYAKFQGMVADIFLFAERLEQGW